MGKKEYKPFELKLKEDGKHKAIFGIKDKKAVNKIACVDLDGIITKERDWRGFGEFPEPRENARWGLNKLKELGYEVVVWTCRGDTLAIYKYLKEHDLPFDFINFHSATHLEGQTSRKIYADVYIDDRALGCPKDWMEIIALLKVKTKNELKKNVQ